MPDKDEKTEEPTAKRKQQARSKGQIAQSQDLSSGVMVLFGVLILAVFGQRLVNNTQMMMVQTWQMIPTFSGEQKDILRVFVKIIHFMVYVLYPILVSLLVVGVVGQIAQKGIGLYWTKLKPDFGKVLLPQNLLKGFKRIFFSKDTFINLLKNVAKMVVIGWVVYGVMESHFYNLLYLVDMDLIQMISKLVWVAFEIAIKVAILLMIIGIADFIYQKRKHHSDLKMTKQEVKDEGKMMLGDPKVIQKRKQAMYKMYQQFMSQQVPEATVVITNPTYIAIAIRYVRGEDEVPTVVAKGKRKAAEKIRTIATENDIPIVENKPLARAMYDQVEAGMEIPADFYNSVAEVLAFVFSAQGAPA